jgi:hypothetical protein
VSPAPANRDGGKLQDHGNAGAAAVEGDLTRLDRPHPWSPPSEGGMHLRPDGFVLTPIGDLLAEPEERVAWLVPDLMPAGGLVFVAAKPKAGKSTLVRNLALAVAQGGDFLGRRCTQGPVIYLALEERRSEVRRHFRGMGADHRDPVFVHVARAPVDGLAALIPLIQKHGPILVVVDPLLRFTRVRDEKAYAELSNALEGVMAAAREHEVCIVATHHAPKAQGTEAIDALLGSTALSGAPDTVMVLRRQEQRRTVETVQRYGLDLERTVLVLDPETGIVRLADTVAEAHRQEDRQRVLSALEAATELTRDELAEAADTRRADVLQAVAGLIAGGSVLRSGAGRKGDPYRYRLAGVGQVSNSNSVPDPTLGTAERNLKMAPNPLQGLDLFRSGDLAHKAGFEQGAGTGSGPLPQLVADLRARSVEVGDDGRASRWPPAMPVPERQALLDRLRVARASARRHGDGGDDALDAWEERGHQSSCSPTETR